MKHKTILLALSAACAAVLAVPTMASAAGWDIDPASGKFPLTFTSAGGTAQLTSSIGTIDCTSNAGTGKYTTATTGDIELTFHGCTSPIGTACTTSGQPSGTITTTELDFHNIMIESTEQVAGGTPGVLITPTNGHFATFSCSFLGTIVVGGTGIIGDLESPKCGGTSNTGALVFESQSAGVQKYMQAETTGTKFDLTSSLNGGSPVTASEDATGTVTFSENATVTCP